MKNLSLYFFGALIVVSGVMPLMAAAQSGNSPDALPTGSALGGNGGPTTVPNPLGFTNFCDLVKALLNIVLAIGVPIAVLFLVWSGFRFILARGRLGELEIARKNFMYVIIGIAVFLGAWTLATVISATIKSLPGGAGVAICGK